MNELALEKKQISVKSSMLTQSAGRVQNLLAMSREWNAVQQARAQQETGKFSTSAIIRQDPSHGRRHNGVA
jgi:hypothetical protein